MMVERGAAWFEPEYSDGDELYHLENEARDAKRGLWALPKEDKIEPWEWRRIEREKAEAEWLRKHRT